MSIRQSTPLLDVRVRKSTDLVLVGLALALGIASVLTLTSVGRDGSEIFYKKQIIWLGVGSACLVATALIGSQTWRRATRAIYIANLVLLVAVMLFGPETKGAVRWIMISRFQFQPSEFAKLFVIVCLAGLLAHESERLDRFAVLLRTLAYVGVPALLVLKQPDLGTALVLLAIWFGMVFVAGARLVHLGIVLVAAMLLFGVMLRAGMVHDYQVKRLLVCFRPDSDPQGAGYQVKQSRIAIGSGRLIGKGFGKGTQTQGRFIPERQTDFIFTVIAEEGGFVAAVLVVLAYTGIQVRGWRIVAQTADPFARLVATGVLCMLGFHVVVNLGMTMGIMPVTGVPLPLLSYGGSSMIVTLSAIGLLVGVGIRRDALVF